MKTTYKTTQHLFRSIIIASIGMMLIYPAKTIAAPNKQFKVDISVDKPDGVYSCGDDVTFTATVTKNGKVVENGSILLEVSSWTGEILNRKKVALKNGKAQINITSEKPCCVYCKGLFLGKGITNKIEESWGQIGVAFDPTKIKTSTKMPEDFDDFWAAGRKKAAEIPLDLKITRCKSPVKYADIFKVSVANINDTRAYAYMIVPLEQKPPFAVNISVYSAGPKPDTLPKPSKIWNNAGVITLIAGVHPYDIPPLDGSSESLKTAYPGQRYPTIGAPDREKTYFYRAILGIDRLIEYVATRPDVDLKHFVMTGQSQGGGFALILGGLNKRFTAISAVIPGMCDHVAYRQGRATGWPGLVPHDETYLRPRKEKNYREFSAYFDAVNFARKIKVPTIIGVGLIDHICRPAATYAAYNEIKAPKQILSAPKKGHSNPKKFRIFFRKWLLGQLGIADMVPPRS